MLTTLSKGENPVVHTLKSIAVLNSVCFYLLLCSVFSAIEDEYLIHMIPMIEMVQCFHLFRKCVCPFVIWGFIFRLSKLFCAKAKSQYVALSDHSTRKWNWILNRKLNKKQPTTKWKTKIEKGIATVFWSLCQQTADCLLFFYIEFKWKSDGNLVYIDSDFTSIVYL